MRFLYIDAVRLDDVLHIPVVNFLKVRIFFRRKSYHARRHIENACDLLRRKTLAFNKLSVFKRQRYILEVKPVVQYGGLSGIFKAPVKLRPAPL